jgi:hypothetical protein
VPRQRILRKANYLHRVPRLKRGSEADADGLVKCGVFSEVLLEGELWTSSGEEFTSGCTINIAEPYFATGVSLCIHGLMVIEDSKMFRTKLPLYSLAVF